MEEQIQLTIDKSVSPMAQFYRRIPFALRSKLEFHLEELIAMEFINQADGHCPELVEW